MWFILFFFFTDAVVLFLFRRFFRRHLFVFFYSAVFFADTIVRFFYSVDFFAVAVRQVVFLSAAAACRLIILFRFIGHPHKGYRCGFLFLAAVVFFYSADFSPMFSILLFRVFFSVAFSPSPLVFLSTAAACRLINLFRFVGHRCSLSAHFFFITLPFYLVVDVRFFFYSAVYFAHSVRFFYSAFFSPSPFVFFLFPPPPFLLHFRRRHRCLFFYFGRCRCFFFIPTVAVVFFIYILFHDSSVVEIVVRWSYIFNPAERCVFQRPGYYSSGVGKWSVDFYIPAEGCIIKRHEWEFNAVAIVDKKSGVGLV